MRNFALTFAVMLFLILSMGLSAEAFAQTPTRNAPIMLFDGQSTNGWSKANGDQHEGWVVVDGALLRKEGGGDLYHEGTWRDFELHFQWRISKGGNSGLKYRVKKYGGPWLGCEYQLLDDQDAKEGNKTASLYDIYQPVRHKPVVHPDVWQHSKIVVCRNRIEHWLNGVLVVQANVGSEEWDTKVAASKFRDREDFAENREGRIFLQDHGNPVWFRQIMLVPLNCDQPVYADSSPTQFAPTQFAPTSTEPGCISSNLPTAQRSGGFGWPTDCCTPQPTPCSSQPCQRPHQMPYPNQRPTIFQPMSRPALFSRRR